MIDNHTGLQNMEGFVEDLKRELVHAKKHKYRTTLLLVEVDDEISLNGTTFEVVFSIHASEILRKNDSIYRMAKNRFVAILPATYEAGGEATALRLKRLIPEKIKKHLNKPFSLSVGVLSIDPQEVADHIKLLDTLEKDLIRDQKCQKIDLDFVKTKTKKEKTKNVAIIGTKSQELDVVASILSLKKNCEVYFTDNREKGLNALRGQKKGVLIIDPDISLEFGLEICKKVRSDRELHDIYIICLHKNSNLDFGIKDLTVLADEILPLDIGIDQIVRSVSSGFRFLDLKKEISKIPILLDILDFIGHASHQLNQPLQIIIGKIEILLLNVEDGNVAATLKEIRKQALRTADINQKILRLVKHNISSEFSIE